MSLLIFVGKLSHLEPDGTPTGIYKVPVVGPIILTTTGLDGDVQADRRVHGGPEKALHHYPAQHYARLAAHYPAIAAALAPGSLGENLSLDGLDETTVCVGDIYTLGECRIQVSQPRSPCWKINHKFSEPGLSRFIADQSLTGWYYRVLASGTVQLDDRLKLIARNPEPITLARLWALQIDHRPSRDELRTVAATPGLNPDWARKLNQRASWLGQWRK